MSLRRNDAPGNAGTTDNPEASTGQKKQKQLDFSGRRMLLRERLTDDTHVKHLLRVLMDHTPDDETDCWLCLDTIVREMSSTPRTVQRSIKQAKDQKFLIVFGPRCGRNCNTYRLRIAEIYERAKVDLTNREESKKKEPDANLAPEERQIVTPDAPNRRPRGANLAHRNSTETISKPPPKRGAGATPPHTLPTNGGWWWKN